MEKVKCPHCNARFMHTHVCKSLKNTGITRNYVETYDESLKLYQTGFDAPIYFVAKNDEDAKERLKKFSGDLYGFLWHSIDQTNECDYTWSTDDIPLGYIEGESQLPIGAYTDPEKYSDFENHIEYMNIHQKKKLFEKLKKELSNV